MKMNSGVNGVDDWIKNIEETVTGAGKVRAAYNKATGKNKPDAVQYEPIITPDTTLKLYLAAGAVALVAWVWLMRK